MHSIKSVRKCVIGRRTGQKHGTCDLMNYNNVYMTFFGGIDVALKNIGLNIGQVTTFTEY